LQAILPSRFEPTRSEDGFITGETFMLLSRKLKMALFALLAAVTATFVAPTVSQAQQVNIRIIKGGWFIGGAGGNGTFTIGRRVYPLTIGGLSAGLIFGGSVTDLHGRAYNVRRVSDIEGVYSAVGAGGAALIGGQALRLRNGKGVVLELTGNKVGLEFALDLSGLAISLAR
jgi:hypothetical protein